jgi:hypothetical protein
VCDWCEQIAVEKANLISESETLGIAVGNVERCLRGIDSGDGGVRPVARKCYRNRTRPGAHIDQPRLVKSTRESGNFFYKVLGFWPRDKDIRRDNEWHAVKLGLSNDVLDGLTGETTLDQGSEFVTVTGRVIPMGNKPRGVSLSIVSFKQMQK